MHNKSDGDRTIKLLAQDFPRSRTQPVLQPFGGIGVHYAYLEFILVFVKVKSAGESDPGVKIALADFTGQHRKGLLPGFGQPFSDIGLGFSMRFFRLYIPGFGCFFCLFSRRSSGAWICSMLQLPLMALTSQPELSAIPSQSASG